MAIIRTKADYFKDYINPLLVIGTMKRDFFYTDFLYE